MPKIPDKVRKTGRFHNDEKTFIGDNIKTLGLRQTARKMNRKEAAVKKIALEMGIKVDDTYSSDEIVYQQIEADLRRTPEWRSLRTEFTKRELKYFAHRYAKHMAHFRENITAPEETQLAQLIRYEIYMQRIASDAKASLRDKKRIELLIQRFWLRNKDADLDDAAMKVLNDLEQKVASLRAGETSKSTEMVKYQEKHMALMKELKATRDQRLNKVESSKDNIVSLIKALQEESFRNAEGDKLERVKIVAKKEFNRLAEYHTYIDGEIDKPILSADTVDDLPEEEESLTTKEDNDE